MLIKRLKTVKKKFFTNKNFLFLSKNLKFEYLEQKFILDAFLSVFWLFFICSYFILLSLIFTFKINLNLNLSVFFTILINFVK